MRLLYLYTFSLYENASLIIFSAETEYISTRYTRYTRAREILLKALDDIGFDKSRFGLHSLRSGGASTAANKGVSERLLKAYGR